MAREGDGGQWAMVDLLLRQNTNTGERRGRRRRAHFAEGTASTRGSERQRERKGDNAAAQKPLFCLVGL